MCFVYKSLIKFSFLKNKCQFIVLGCVYVSVHVYVCLSWPCVCHMKEGIRTQLVVSFINQSTTQSRRLGKKK